MIYGRFQELSTMFYPNIKFLRVNIDELEVNLCLIGRG